MLFHRESFIDRDPPRAPIRLRGQLLEAFIEVREVHQRGMKGDAPVSHHDNSRLFPVELLVRPLQELSVGKAVRIRPGHEPDAADQFITPFDPLPESRFSTPGARPIGKKRGGKPPGDKGEQDGGDHGHGDIGQKQSHFDGHGSRSF